MVKGITRRVIVIKSPDPNIFDEAIFIVKDDAVRRGVTNEEILREAQNTAQDYIRRNRSVKPSFLARIPAPAFTLIGAGFTAVLWLIVRLI